MAEKESPLVVILTLIIAGAILAAYQSPLQTAGAGIAIIGFVFLVVYLYHIVRGNQSV